MFPSEALVKTNLFANGRRSQPVILPHADRSDLRFLTAKLDNSAAIYGPGATSEGAHLKAGMLAFPHPPYFC